MSRSGLGGPTPFNVYLPAGNWTAKWTLPEYTDLGVPLVMNQDYDYSVGPLGPLFMTTSAVHIYEAVSSAAFDPTVDKLTVLTWLNRDGSRIPGPIEGFYQIIDQDGIVVANIGSPTAADPKNAQIAVNWRGKQAPTPPHEPALPNASGYFTFTFNAPTGLQAGKSYVGVAKIKIASGGIFETPKPFDVTTPTMLQAVSDTVNANLDKPLSQVKSDIVDATTILINAQTSTIQTQLNTQTGLIDTKLTETQNTISTTLTAQTNTITTAMNNQTTLIQNTLTSFENTVADSVDELEDAAQQSLDAADNLEKTAERFSWDAQVSPNPALAGDTIVLTAQGPASKHPIASVFTKNGGTVLNGSTMSEDSKRPGTYTASFLASRLTAGESYTFMVTEDTTGGLAAGSGIVESTSLSSLLGLVSAAPQAKSEAQAAKEAILRVEQMMTKGGEMNGVKDQITQLKTTIDQIPAMIEKALFNKQSPIADTRKMVEDIQKQLHELLQTQDSTSGLVGLVSKAVSANPDVKEIRQRADNINQATVMMSEIMEKKMGGKDEPVVRSFYTS